MQIFGGITDTCTPIIEKRLRFNDLLPTFPQYFGCPNISLTTLRQFTLGQVARLTEQAYVFKLLIRSAVFWKLSPALNRLSRKSGVARDCVRVGQRVFSVWASRVHANRKSSSCRAQSSSSTWDNRLSASQVQTLVLWRSRHRLPLMTTGKLR